MGMDMFQFSPKERRFYGFLVASSWLCNIAHGLTITILGPTQIYLARNVGVNIDTINLVWSFGFLGYMAGSFAAGMAYKQFFRSKALKLIFIGATIGLSGLIVCVLPFLRTFGVLVTVRCVQNVLLGAFITADASIVVYTMGPHKSRPFTNALHAMVGVGFLFGTFLVRPFLPTDATAAKTRNDVCIGTSSNSNSTTVVVVDPDAAEEDEYLWGVQKIAWPFLITGLWSIVCSFGYIVLAFLPSKMPRYYEDASEEECNRAGDDDDGASESVRSTTGRRSEPRIEHTYIVLFLLFFYYFCSCGIERLFQSMAYTFGICGPLSLPPSEAVLIDSFYSGGFLVGRIISIFVAFILRPRNMIFACLVGCLTAAALLVAMAHKDIAALYGGVCLFGLSVSWQFGSCYSWVAKKMDVTGRLSPLFFLGCGLGSAGVPPLAGFLFTSSWGPRSVPYLALIMVALISALWTAMWLTGRKMRFSAARGGGGGGGGETGETVELKR